MKYKVGWEEMEEFRGIDLFDSFVLSWAEKEGELIFEIEASIWPESKQYSKPLQDEFTCYKNGVLKFSGFNSISGLRLIESVDPTVDPDGSKDYGNIEYFAKIENGYEIHGEFGKVSIKNGDFKFTINA